MKTSTGFVQGFNAQAAVTADQVVVAAELTASPIDVHQLEPLIVAATTNLADAGVAEPVGVALADAGYYSTGNATMDAGCALLIAPTKAKSLPVAAPPATPDPQADTERAEHERAARLAEAFDRTIAGELTLTAAASELGMSVSRASVLRRHYEHHGLDALVRRKRANGEGRRPVRVARETLVRHGMLTRLATPEGRELYAQRATAVEPVFGQLKAGRGIRRFRRRGLAACASEWKLLAATHNLLKLWRHRLAIA